MSGHIVVGYTATEAGEDAVALGARLAAASGSELEVVVVLPADDRSVITPPDASYDRYLRDQAASWLEKATAGISEGVAH
ncbi:MAG: universal stress protein, partial [Microbacterium sp.]